MTQSDTSVFLVPEERIADKVLLIRGIKVMLDRDLAELYGVETRRLNEQGSRNRERIPEDFMFQLSKEEFKDWKSQFAISNPAVKWVFERDLTQSPSKAWQCYQAS